MPFNFVKSELSELNIHEPNSLSLSSMWLCCMMPPHIPAWYGYGWYMYHHMDEPNGILSDFSFLLSFDFLLRSLYLFPLFQTINIPRKLSKWCDDKNWRTLREKVLSGQFFLFYIYFREQIEMKWENEHERQEKSTESVKSRKKFVQFETNIENQKKKNKWKEEKKLEKGKERKQNTVSRPDFIWFS